MPAIPKFFNDLEVEELVYGPPEVIRTEEDFRPYQKWMSEAVIDAKKVYLAAEMGLGKTACVLHAFSQLFAFGQVRRLLVVAPLKVAEDTWPDEIAAWSFARGLSYVVVTGGADQREAALSLGPRDVTIINRENLSWLYQKFGPARWPFDALVYDEATRLSSGRFKTAPTVSEGVRRYTNRDTNLGVINKVWRKLNYIVLLSGTPAPKGLINLWGPIYALDRGARLGEKFTSFKDRWFRQSKYGYEVEPFAHSRDEIMGRIKDVFFSLREEDYLKLPKLVVADRFVDLPPSVLKRYRDFERKMAIEVVKNREDREVVRALTKGVLLNKLLQFANGSLYVEDGSDVPQHTEKLRALESIIEEANGKPVLVAYSFRFDLDAIKKRFPHARIFGQNQNDKREWNEGKIPLMLIHPASAGHGLNIQRGSNIAVWYGLTWSMELYKQFIKRLHRSGQTEDHVFIYRILARNTVDMRVARVLSKREVDQNAITDMVRVYLEEVA
jgi:SNF2 family DNA or RNA helicase